MAALVGDHDGPLVFPEEAPPSRVPEVQERKQPRTGLRDGPRRHCRVTAVQLGESKLTAGATRGTERIQVRLRVNGRSGGSD
jgi:hypothetical protein